MYYNKNDIKIDQEDELKVLNKLFDEFDLGKHGSEKFGICCIVDAETWTGCDKQIIHPCI